MEVRRLGVELDRVKVELPDKGTITHFKSFELDEPIELEAGDYEVECCRRFGDVETRFKRGKGEGLNYD